MTDTVTVLAGEAGRRASKLWQADGTTADYDAGWQFQPHSVPVANLDDLHRLLTAAQTQPHCLVIRGVFRGMSHAAGIVREDGPAVTAEGWVRRWKELFDDVGHHWMCVDIDKYTPPAGIDPVLDPVRAIEAFIAAHLPEEFDGAGFCWQLSSSAGHPTKAGLLKAHVWFWLALPYMGAELEAWAPAAVDRTLYRTVQVHYTALPVFAPGVVDPVPVRSGYVPGPVVPLILTPAERGAAGAPRAGRDMIDPRTKTGVVGAFCRAYSIEQVIAGPLADQFSFDPGSDRRLTWSRGGGARGGAYLSDDRMHLCNEHNTSPVGNSPLNAFDAVRVYCYGALDAAADPLALVQMQTTPSYRAMREWAAGLPEVAGILATERAAAVGVPVAAEVPAADVGAASRAIVPVALGVDTFLMPAQQATHFAGCTYISSMHRIITPDGEFHDQQRFNATYGGRSFSMDLTNERVVRSAWECFLESQAIQFPKVYGCIFRPELPSGHAMTLEGRNYVNSYVPIVTRQVEGDPGKFLDLLNRILPDKRDQRIMLTYMASLIRNPGKKFQWWPVLQGAQGNGKTAFIKVLQHCVGFRYTNLPNTGELARNGIKFNSWIAQCLFLGFEEVYVPGRREFLEEMKPVVTNDRLAVERKGVDVVMEDNRANGLMCTNHKDGVPVGTDNRRYAIFFTHQQEGGDTIRDGLVPSYFFDLYDWFHGRGEYVAGGANYGYSVVNWYLRTQYALDPEFDPAGLAQVAPKTSSSAAAIAASHGLVEQEILEAIEQGEVGFRGDWVSGKALDRLLERTKKTIPRNKRLDVMRSLGYDWHPHLHGGRSTYAATIMDGVGKFIIYAKRGSLITQIRDSQEIMKKYIADQS